MLIKGCEAVASPEELPGDNPAISRYRNVLMPLDLDIAGRVEKLLTGQVEAQGYSLLEVQYRFEGHWVLRLLIEKEGGINHVDCGAVTELAGRILEVEDPIPNEFALEVSSPGLFRPLREIRHYRQSIGKVIRLTLEAGFIKERKKRVVRGKLLEVLEEAVLVESDGQPLKLPFTGIRSARLDPDPWKGQK